MIYPLLLIIFITRKMNNLQIFRAELEKFAPKGEIADRQQWNQLMERLCDLKLLNPRQVKLLQQNSSKRNFPITILELEQIIMKQFGSEQNKALLNDLLTIQKQIRETKGVLNIWKDKGLSNNEISALRVLFAKGNHKIKEICKTLQQKKQLMQGICEQEIQLIKSMDQWIIMQKLTKTYADFEQYRAINDKVIEGLFSQIKVREVHFRTKKGKSKNEGIFTEIGYNSKNDEPVEVTKIYKKYTNFDYMNQILITFNAFKDLSLSPYFLRFKGYNNSLDPDYFLYFRQYTETLNLRFIVYDSKCELDQNVGLFKFWAGQIFRALRDLYTMSSYLPILPIRLEDFEVSDHGLRVILKNVRFEVSREIEDDTLEPKLLENLGNILLELLKISHEEVNQKIKNVENVSLINSLLKAQQGYQKYKDKIVPCFINFFNAQTHPLFESIEETEGIEVINNFTVLYGDYA